MPKAAASTAKSSKRASKDKSGPKRPLSAYMFFSKQYREQVKEQNANATFGQIGKILGEMWRSMDEEQKKPFSDKAAKDKERYTNEKKAYEATTA